MLQHRPHSVSSDSPHHRNAAATLPQRSCITALTPRQWPEVYDFTHYFASCASQTTHCHAIIARETFCVLFSHGSVLFDTLNVQKRAIKSDTSGHCLLTLPSRSPHSAPAQLHAAPTPLSSRLTASPPSRCQHTARTVTHTTPPHAALAQRHAGLTPPSCRPHAAARRSSLSPRPPPHPPPPLPLRLTHRPHAAATPPSRTRAAVCSPHAAVAPPSHQCTLLLTVPQPPPNDFEGG